MDANVDECAELGDVGDDAFEDHFGLHVGELTDFFIETGSDNLLTRIAARLTQLLQNVLDGERAGVDLEGIDLDQKLRICDQLADQCTQRASDLLDHRIRFRMDSRAIQRILAVADAQETGSLLVRFGPDAGDFVELFARAKASMFVAVRDDIQRDSFRDSGDVAQQRPRGSIEIDADAVNATFDSCLQ